MNPWHRIAQLPSSADSRDSLPATLHAELRTTGHFMAEVEKKLDAKVDRPTSWAVAWLVLGFAAIVASLVGAVLVFKQVHFLPEEVALPLLIVACVTVLILALATAAIIFRRLGLANRVHAMGLPEGSIRAIIALLLVLIFAVVAVFLIANADRHGSRVIERITQAQANEYAASEVFSRVTMPSDIYGEDPSGDPWIRLTLRSAPSPSAEMSQQLLTTLGTLVVAIASFYFGSQVVQSARASGLPRDETQQEGGQESGVPVPANVIPRRRTRGGLLSKPPGQ